MFIGDSAHAKVVLWKLALMQYDFDIEHISGAKNVVADYLSRLVKVIWRIIKTSTSSL